MARLSRFAVLRPWRAVGVWVLLVVLVGIVTATLSGSLNNSFSLPDTESTKAQTLLQQAGAGGSSGGADAKVVWKVASGKADGTAARAVILPALRSMAAIPSVGCVTSPFGAPLGAKCPKQPPAQAGDAGTTGGAGSIGGAAQASKLSSEAAKAMAGAGPTGTSPDGTIAFATVSFSGDASNVPAADAKKVLSLTTGLDSAAVTAGVNGQVIDFASTEPPSAEGIGIGVALVILLFTFGSLVGAFLPILSAIMGLGLGLALVTVVARYLDVATFAPTLASMIGLGVGIDYSLFVINRFKQALDAGRSPGDAALESVRTAGRAVYFAAGTVVIALMGLFVMRINFFNGLAVAAVVTVFMVMLSATFLLPAVLSLLGHRAFSLRMPWVPKRGSEKAIARRAAARPTLFARYGLWLEKHYRVAGLAALATIVLIALPTFSLRLGFSDDSGKAAGSASRIAYDLVSAGFGPGINGPFFVAVDHGAGKDTAQKTADVSALASAMAKDPGVALAFPVPAAAGATVSAMLVVPTTAPQDQGTTDLLTRLRSDVIPSAESGQTFTAYVGGTQAITSDFTKVLVDALPLFLLIVVGLGFLALTVLFRSLVIPLTAAITSLLSLGAALGVTVAVFQWGWAASALGVAGTGPIQPFLPVMVFAILFGLSMDYQVFLVSRMQEEWGHTGDNRSAVRRGLAGSGRVVAIAAAIMTSVFAAFVLTNDSTIKLFGLALSSAVLLDAFLVRLIVVPSVMYQLGNVNWYLPAWLRQRLPAVSVESEDDIEAAAHEIADVEQASADLEKGLVDPDSLDEPAPVGMR